MRCGILLRLVEDRDTQAGLLKESPHAFGMAGSDNTRIGDEQNFGRQEFAGQIPYSFGAIDAENQTGARLMIERGKGGELGKPPVIQLL
jgi:hypothetical protein